MRAESKSFQQFVGKSVESKQNQGVLRVFHRENSLFLWKTFLISLGNDCGNCLNREKQQNRKRILTAKNAAFHANRSHPAEPYREISVCMPDGKKSDTISLPHNPGVVNCTEGRNVSATIVYVMAAHLFTEWPVQNSRALARCVGIIAAATAPWRIFRQGNSWALARCVGIITAATAPWRIFRQGNSRALARCVGIITACMASALVSDKTLENFPPGKFSGTCPLCWNYNCLHGKCISIRQNLGEFSVREILAHLPVVWEL